MLRPLFNFEAIGTKWQIDSADELSAAEQSVLLEKIKDRIAVFDQAYSRFREDSLVAAMSRASGSFELPTDAAPMLELYRALYRLTEGAFTPLIGQVLIDAGYDARYSLQARSLHQPPSWEEVIEYHLPNLTMKKPAMLDFGAAGKGYLIDIVAALLRDSELRSFCIDAGGDIFYQHAAGEKLRVGLEHPENVRQVIGVAEIIDQSICGSAGNRRRWGKFHHIVNPHTLTSPNGILATWAVASTTMLADALATCLFFVRSATLRTVYDFEYLILYPDYSVEISPRFPGEIFLKSSSV